LDKIDDVEGQEFELKNIPSKSPVLESKSSKMEKSVFNSKSEKLAMSLKSQLKAENLSTKDSNKNKKSEQ
jgi:hypothetical protein